MSIRRTLLRSPRAGSLLSIAPSRRLVVLAMVALSITCGAAESAAAPPASEARSSPASTTPHVSDLVLPSVVGTVEGRSQGAAGKPLVFVIGESHVNLDVQEAVASSLVYLHHTFGVEVIGSEGFSGPLPLPESSGSRGSRYAAAWSEFVDRRNINAVEYFALTHPAAEVHGVSSIAAYSDHGEALQALVDKQEAWAGKLQQFIRTEVATLRVSQRQGERLQEAEDLEELGNVLCEVAGRSSAICRKLKGFLKEQQEIDSSSEQLISPDHPLMRARDRALVANTLELSGTRPSALVVGYFHVPGVEKELKARGVPYLTIVPPGVAEQIAGGTPMSPEDNEVWQRWDEKTLTKLERWLGPLLRSTGGHKPAPPLTREGFRNQVEVFEALVYADHLLLAGSSEPAVIRILAQGNFPEPFQVVHCYQIDGGQAIEFKVGRETGFALFGDRSPPGQGPRGAEELKIGKLPDGRQYAIYGGGSGQPPGLGPPPGGWSSDDDPFRRLRAVVERQQRERADVVTIAFRASGNVLFRFVNGAVRALAASPSWIADRRRRLDEEPLGPETFLAAHGLAEVLLADIESDLPEGESSVLYQVSENDILGRVSLPFLARFASHPSARKLESFTEVYSVPPASRDLEQILVETIPPVDIGKTVVWVADSLRDHPLYPEVKLRIQDVGTRLNVPPTPDDTLILLGDPRGDWAVELLDVGPRRADTEIFRADLARASSVVAIGAGLTEQDGDAARSLHDIDATVDSVLDLGRRAVDAMARASGRETLDRALRDVADEETSELKELVGTEGGLERFADSAALFSKNATLRSRT